MNDDEGSEPAPSESELIAVVSNLSELATGSTWQIQTSSAIWYLATYGGQWERLAAHDAAAELDRAQLIAATLDRWPVLSEPEPDESGLPSQDVTFVGYRDFATPRRLVEQEGVVEAAGILHLLSDRQARRLGCGRVTADLPLVPVTAPRRSGRPWCVACAVPLTADVGRDLGWTVPTEA